MQQVDMFKDDLSMEDQQKLAELCQENAANLEAVFQHKVGILENLKNMLEEGESKVKELKQQIAKIEEEELPNLMLELQVDILSFQNGLSIMLDEKLHTSVNKPERRKAWELLRQKGFTGIIKPVIKVTIAQDELEKDINELITMIQNSIEFEEVELAFDYHAGQLSAVARDILDSGQELEPQVFRQFLKRGVKIKQKPTKRSQAHV
jgi:hypothetical protein